MVTFCPRFWNKRAQVVSMRRNRASKRKQSQEYWKIENIGIFYQSKLLGWIGVEKMKEFWLIWMYLKWTLFVWERAYQNSNCYWGRNKRKKGGFHYSRCSSELNLPCLKVGLSHSLYISHLPGYHWAIVYSWDLGLKWPRQPQSQISISKAVTCEGHRVHWV